MGHGYVCIPSSLRSCTHRARLAQHVSRYIHTAVVQVRGRGKQRVTDVRWLLLRTRSIYVRAACRHMPARGSKAGHTRRRGIACTQIQRRSCTSWWVQCRVAGTRQVSWRGIVDEDRWRRVGAGAAPCCLEVLLYICLVTRD